MASRKPKTVLFRRKRESRTDYGKRLKILLAHKARVVVRFTNQKIIAQLVQFEPQGDRVVLGIESSKLKKLGWDYSLKNLPAAYLTGLMFGKEALAKDQKEGVFDTGFKTPLHKGKVYAFLKGVVDSGFTIPHGEEDIFPSEERLSGKHLEEYAAQGENKEKYAKLAASFKQIKEKLSS